MMPQVNIPTDSIYKTAAISGVAMMLIPLVLVFLSYFILVEQFSEDAVDRILAERSVERYQNVSTTTKKEISVIEQIEIINQLEHNLGEAIMQDVVSDYTKHLYTILWILSVLFIVIGTWLAQWGFTNWYRKLQIPLDTYYSKISEKS